MRKFVLAAAAVVLVCGVTHAAGSSSHDDKSYRAGIGLLNKGMHDLAAAELRKFLDGSPESPDAPMAHYALGVCLWRLNQPAQAASEFDAVLKLPKFEYRPDALLLRAQSAAAVGDEERSIQVLRTLLKEFGQAPQADAGRAMLGQRLYSLRKYEEAEGVLRDAVERCTGENRDRARLLLGLTLAATEKFAEAADVLDELGASGAPPEVVGPALIGEAQCRQRMGQLDRALALFERAQKQPGVSAEAALGRAQVLRMTGRAAEASDVLNETEPGSIPEPLRGAFMLEQGRAALDAGSVDEARRSFERLGKSGEASVQDDAAYWLAKCDLRAGKLDAAANAMRRAAESHPQSPLLAEMLFDEASARSRASEEVAAELWAQWRERFAGHALEPEAVAAQAGCESSAENYDACVALCEEFGRRWPGHARSASMTLLGAECRFAAGEFEQALPIYTALVRSSEDAGVKWRASVRRGLCLVRVGETDAGVRELRAAIGTGGPQQDELVNQAITVLGEQAMLREDWQEGAEWYAKLASRDVGDQRRADAMLRAGLCLQRDQRGEEAIRAFDEVMTLDEDSAVAVHAKFEKAQLLVDAGRDAEAGRLLEDVIEAESGAGDKSLTPHAVRHLAAIATRAGDPGRAAELLGTLEGGDAQVGFDRAGALLAAGDYDAAEEAFRQWLDANARHPRATEGRVMLGIAVNRLGRNEEAIELLSGIDGTKLETRIAASLHYERALALRTVGRSADALAVYGELLESDEPGQMAAYAALDAAQLALEAGKFDEALELVNRCEAEQLKLPAEQVARIAPRQRLARAVCLVNLNRASDAAEVLGKFEKEFPDDSLRGRVASLLGDALLRSGRPKEAAAALRRAIELDPAPATTGPALLRLGEACAALQDWSGSEEAYTRYLDEHGDAEVWFQARFGQGWARENQGRHDAAMEAYRDVVARHDGATAARAQFQIGECLFAQKKHEEAVAELLKVDVLYAYPEWSAAALYEAGRCLAELRRTADAARQFDEVVERFPESSWAALARERREAIKPESLPGKPREVSRAR
ncbi:MAG: tetratricopeptide repeat protein [Phycisphaerales bacterium]|nr:tetratricopeptide repeat protein [Phycisphaerales bacterium]